MTQIYRFLAAAAIIFLVVWWLPISTINPPESWLYCSLLRLRPSTPESDEIVIVEYSTSEAQQITLIPVQEEILLILIEMMAETALVILPESRASGSAPTGERRPYIERRFAEEFALADENISSLFDAILRGTIPPGESEKFVGELLRLLDESEARLVSDVLQDAPEQLRLTEQAQTVLGSLRIGRQLSDLGIVLPEYADRSVVIVPPRHGDSIPFRRLDARVFINYVDMKSALLAQLQTMEFAGYFDTVDPEKRPTYLFEYTSSRRNEMLEASQADSVSGWREAQNEYIRGVDSLLDGSIEAGLIDGFDMIDTGIAPDDSGASRIGELKREVSDAFEKASSLMGEYKTVRAGLEEQLRGSFIILAPKPVPERQSTDVWSDPSLGEALAADVNSALIDSYVLAPFGRLVRLWSLLICLVVAGILTFTRPPLAAIAGASVPVLALAGIAVLFLAVDLWVDSRYLSIVLAAAVVSSVVPRAILRSGIKRTLSGSIAHRFPKRSFGMLLSRVERGASIETEAEIAIVAVQYFETPANAEGPGPTGISLTQTEFQNSIAKEITDVDGVVVGSDGAVVYGAFGISIERIGTGRGSDLPPELCMEKACSAVIHLTESDERNGYVRRYGIDAGKATFFVSAIHGFSANGRAMIYARRLSGLTKKYNCRALVSQRIAEEIEAKWDIKKRGDLVDSTREETRPFYELIGPHPS